VTRLYCDATAGAEAEAIAAQGGDTQRRVRTGPCMLAHQPSCGVRRPMWVLMQVAGLLTTAAAGIARDTQRNTRYKAPNTHTCSRSVSSAALTFSAVCLLKVATRT
jgi:hypothetical protein